MRRIGAWELLLGITWSEICRALFSTLNAFWEKNSMIPRFRRSWNICPSTRMKPRTAVSVSRYVIIVLQRHDCIFCWKIEISILSGFLFGKRHGIFTGTNLRHAAGKVEGHFRSWSEDSLLGLRDLGGCKEGIGSQEGFCTASLWEGDDDWSFFSSPRRFRRTMLMRSDEPCWLRLKLPGWTFSVWWTTPRRVFFSNENGWFFQSVRMVL